LPRGLNLLSTISLSHPWVAQRPPRAPLSTLSRLDLIRPGIFFFASRRHPPLPPLPELLAECFPSYSCTLAPLPFHPFFLFSALLLQVLKPLSSLRLFFFAQSCRYLRNIPSVLPTPFPTAVFSTQLRATSLFRHGTELEGGLNFPLLLLRA